MMSLLAEPFILMLSITDNSFCKNVCIVGVLFICVQITYSILLPEVNCTAIYTRKKWCERRPHKCPEWCHVIIVIWKSSEWWDSRHGNKRWRINHVLCMFLMINIDFFIHSCVRSVLLNLLCFSVWSLFSLMLSCVVHRWKKKEYFTKLLCKYTLKMCLFFKMQQAWLFLWTLLRWKAVFFFSSSFSFVVFWSKVQWWCNKAFSSHLLSLKKIHALRLFHGISMEAVITALECLLFFPPPLWPNAAAAM